MSYTNNIPNATDLISNSQAQIKANFTAIDSGTTGTGIGFSRNHITMTDATNGGLHNRVDFYQAVTAPSISGFTSSAYAKTSSAISEFYYKNGTIETQITKSSLTASSGEGFIPGGLQVRAGTSLWPGQSQYVNFSTAFPTTCLSVVVSNANSGSNATIINVISIAANRFQVFSPNISSGSNLSYIAIGY
jgi:hypothetical protein